MTKARLWLAIGAGAIVFIAIYNLSGYSPPAGQALSYSQLLRETEAAGDRRPEPAHERR
jgi:hypothetical protein